MEKSHWDDLGFRMSKECLDNLLEFVSSNGRVCPNPQEWQTLWKMLPDKRRVGSSWDPPLPLILAAWSEPALLKIIRLKEHIEYAYDHGVFEQVDEYLRGLRPEQWFRVKCVDDA